MLDIHSDLIIYTERPYLEILVKQGNKGRTPTRLKPTVSGIRANQYMNTLSRD